MAESGMSVEEMQAKIAKRVAEEQADNPPGGPPPEADEELDIALCSEMLQHQRAGRINFI